MVQVVANMYIAGKCFKRVGKASEDADAAKVEEEEANCTFACVFDA